MDGAILDPLGSLLPLEEEAAPRLDKMSAPPLNPCIALDEQTRLPLLHDAYHMNYAANACSQICLPTALRFTGSKHGVEFGNSCTAMGYTANMVPGKSGPVQFFTFDYSE